MSLESQETPESSGFLSFDPEGNDDNRGANRGDTRGNRGFRNNFQYRPYNRNWNNRNHNFRRNQPFGGQNEGDQQFAPANFSSPVGHQQRYDNDFRNRPNYMNHFQNNRRNFRQFNNHNFGRNNHQQRDAPIEDYVHKSMLEDPWAECHKYKNGANAPEFEEAESSTNELTSET